MIHVGDKVKIATLGFDYTTYPGFLDYYRDVGSSTIVERVCGQYEYGRSPTEEEARTKVFTVMFVRAHGAMEGRKLAVINDGEVTYIVNVEGLSLVFTDIPFTEGDKVFITDSGPVYSMWTSLVKNMATVIPDGEEVYHKWRDGHLPTPDEEGGKSPDGIFTVKWIGHHIARPEEDIIAIISNNMRTYIIGTKGLTAIVDKSWDKYIIYVRNWAVVNKDSAQSAKDATGPKPYAEWLNDRK
jgi:hypothetical protein